MNIYCARCESANPEGAAQCSLCGHPLTAAVNRPIRLVKARRLNRWIKQNTRGLGFFVVFLGLGIPFRQWCVRVDDAPTARQAPDPPKAKRETPKLSVTELDADMNRALSAGVSTWLDVASNSTRMDVTIWMQLTAHQKTGLMYWFSSYFEAKRGFRRVTLMSNLSDQVLATYHPFRGMKIR